MQTVGLNANALNVSLTFMTLVKSNCSQHVILNERQLCSLGCKEPLSEDSKVLRALSPKVFNFKGCDFDLTQFLLPHLEAIISLTQYVCIIATCGDAAETKK